MYITQLWNDFAVDIDECDSSPCEHESTCMDAVNGYTCTCTDGYTGVNCQTGNILQLPLPDVNFINSLFD